MKELFDTYVAGLEIGSLDLHKNLCVASLLRRDAAAEDYIVLEEALSGGLKIMEQKCPDVPEVDIENNTGSEVLIVFGEYLLGGGQNRQVAANIYLEKGFKGKLPVRCIQRGRWNPGSGKEFKEYGGYAPTVTKMGTRLKHNAQGEVWGSIDDIAERTQTFSNTSDLSEIYDKQKESLEEYTAQFAQLPDQVGLVAVIGLNGKKMFVADIFDSYATLQKHYAGLIRAHALEARGRPVDKIEISKDEVNEFLSEFMKASLEDPKHISLGTDYTLSSGDSTGTTLISKEKIRYASLSRIR